MHGLHYDGGARRDAHGARRRLATLIDLFPTGDARSEYKCYCCAPKSSHCFPTVFDFGLGRRWRRSENCAGRRHSNGAPVQFFICTQYVADARRDQLFSRRRTRSMFRGEIAQLGEFRNSKLRSSTNALRVVRWKNLMNRKKIYFSNNDFDEFIYICLGFNAISIISFVSD